MAKITSADCVDFINLKKMAQNAIFWNAKKWKRARKWKEGTCAVREFTSLSDGKKVAAYVSEDQNGVLEVSFDIRDESIPQFCFSMNNRTDGYSLIFNEGAGNALDADIQEFLEDHEDESNDGEYSRFEFYDGDMTPADVLILRSKLRQMFTDMGAMENPWLDIREAEYPKSSTLQLIRYFDWINGGVSGDELCGLGWEYWSNVVLGSDGFFIQPMNTKEDFVCDQHSYWDIPGFDYTAECVIESERAFELDCPSNEDQEKEHQKFGFVKAKTPNPFI